MSTVDYCAEDDHGYVGDYTGSSYVGEYRFRWHVHRLHGVAIAHHSHHIGGRYSPEHDHLPDPEASHARMRYRPPQEDLPDE